MLLSVGGWRVGGTSGGSYREVGHRGREGSRGKREEVVVVVKN